MSLVNLLNYLPLLPIFYLLFRVKLDVALKSYSKKNNNNLTPFFLASSFFTWGSSGVNGNNDDSSSNNKESSNDEENTLKEPTKELDLTKTDSKKVKFSDESTVREFKRTEEETMFSETGDYIEDKDENVNKFLSGHLKEVVDEYKTQTKEDTNEYLPYLEWDNPEEIEYIKESLYTRKQRQAENRKYTYIEKYPRYKKKSAEEIAKDEEEFNEDTEFLYGKTEPTSPFKGKEPNIEDNKLNNPLFDDDDDSKDDFFPGLHDNSTNSTSNIPNISNPSNLSTPSNQSSSVSPESASKLSIKLNPTTSGGKDHSTQEDSLSDKKRKIEEQQEDNNKRMKLDDDWLDID